MKIIKNSFNTVELRKWQKKDRQTVILEELDKIASPWVEKDIEWIEVNNNDKEIKRRE